MPASLLPSTALTLTLDLTASRINPLQLISEDYEYNASGDPCYATTDESQKIQERTEVRLRIVGTKMDQTEIVSGGQCVNCGGRGRKGRVWLPWGCWFRRALHPLISVRPCLKPCLFLSPCKSSSPTLDHLLQFCIGTIKEDFLGVINPRL
jgi:hypothetical protein